MIIEVLTVFGLGLLSFFVTRRGDDLLVLTEAAHGEAATHHDRLEKLTHIADRFYREKRYLPAEKAYMRVLKLDHKNIVAYNRLGFIYSHFANFDDAIECFEIVVKAHPSAIAHQDLAMAYFKKQDYAMAAVELKKAAETEPSTARYLSLARVYRMLRQSHNQLAALQKAADFDPDNVEILNLLAEALMQMKDTDGAKRIYGRIVKLDPKNQRARVMSNSH